METLVIRGGRIVLPTGVIEADIVVEEGKIKAIGRNLEVLNAKVLDASGKLILPGVIDVHVHMREPGLEYKDDFANGTRDALQGGVTTVLEMPNTLPPVDTRERFLEKKKLLESKAYVDFGLYGVIHDGNIEEFEAMVNEGCIGFKIFLGPTTGNIPPPSQPVLYEALSKSGKYKVPLAFHAEEWDLVKYFTEKVKSSGRTDPLVHVDSRPPICEEIAIYRIGLMARETNAIVHIVHMSSCGAVDALKKLKNMGVNVTGETNPHYLLLDITDYKKYGPAMKVNPPVRGGRHKECLWKAVRDKVIDIIASDHAPHSVEEKTRNMWEASSGFPGAYTLLPLMLDAALRGLIPITYIPLLMSEKPAKRFHLYPRKGCLIPGCDADLVIIDPSREQVIDKNKMFCRNKITPFHGWRVKGVIEYTILRGNIVYENGVVTDKPLGVFLKPLRK